MTEQEAIAYIEEWDVTEAAKVLKWYEEDELLRPCDCDTIVAIETEELKDENAKLQEELEAAKHDLSLFSSVLVASKFENAKLRELVRDLWLTGSLCDAIPDMRLQAKGGDWRTMQERVDEALGIEVTE